MKIVHAVALSLLSLIPVTPAVGAAPPGAFPVADAQRVMLFTAAPATFPDGDTGVWTCAAVVVDAAKRLAALPLQCLGAAERIGCVSATQVAPDQQLRTADMRRWLDDGYTCTIARRAPRLDLALIQSTRAFPKGATAARLRATAPLLGERVYTLGFPLQIPSFLASGIVGARLKRLALDGLPDGFDAPVTVVSGAYAKGSAGAGVFDAAGQLVGIVIADLYDMDGGAAIGAAEIRALLPTPAPVSP